MALFKNLLKSQSLQSNRRHTVQEQELRKRIRALREFYQSLVIYGLVNAGLIIVWAVSGGGYFWPIWVIVGWGLGLGISAVSLGLLPQLGSLFPVFSPEWEEEQLRKHMSKGKSDAAEKQSAPKAVKKDAKEEAGS
ncbi:MAG: hypothetical protein C0514_01925 [Candidatus Puniceispirillum sp.]|nr:hypothetical protein [Candidatus Puniceispirillum sp.]